jgi:hypothetical protein
VVTGSLTVSGNLTAQQFIVSSSVTFLTTSFSSGSTRFGDSSDDIHTFTGSLVVSGSVNPLNVGSNLLFVSSSGNVGVGTSSPYGQFTIQNIASNIGGVNFGDATDASSRRWQLRNDTDVFGDFSIRQSTTQNGSTYINRLYVSSSGNIGVGTSTPLSTLVVSATNSGGRGGEISIINSGTAANSETALNFGFGTSTYNGDNGNAQIKALMTNVNEATDIVFSNWSGTSFIERMRITSAGNVNIAGKLGIGASTNPVHLLEVSSAGGSQRIRVGTLQNNGNTSTFEAITTAGISTASSAWFRANAGGNLTIGTSAYTKANGDSGDFNNLSSESATTILTINTSGLKFANGASSLNYYEEGSWTPAIRGNGSFGTAAYMFRSGSYVRIGNYVFIRWGFKLSSFSGASGTMQITGLPFASVNWGSYQEPNISVSTGGLATADYAQRARVFVTSGGDVMEGRIANNSDTAWPVSEFNGDEWIIGEIFYNIA